MRNPLVATTKSQLIQESSGKPWISHSSLETRRTVIGWSPMRSLLTLPLNTH